MDTPDKGASSPFPKKPGRPQNKTREEMAHLTRRSADNRHRRALAARSGISEDLLPPGAQLNPARIRVWERRLLHPFDQSPTPIPLKEQLWTLRWIDSRANGRLFKALYKLGWEPVRIDEVDASADELGITVTPDGIVSRGDRHQEILCKQPEHIHKTIQAQKARQRVEAATKPVGIDTLGQAIASAYGPADGQRAVDILKNVRIRTHRGPEDFGTAEEPPPVPEADAEQPPT